LKTLLCATTALLLYFNIFAQQPVEVKNADFESYTSFGEKLIPTNWNLSIGDTFSYRITCDTTIFHSGKSSCKLYVKEDFPISCCHYDYRLSDSIIGHTIHVKAWVKADRVLEANFQIVIQNAKTQTISQWHWEQVKWDMIGGAYSTDWSLVEKNSIVSDTANTVLLTIYLKPGQSAGTTIWIDDMEVTDLTAGVTYHPLLTNRTRPSNEANVSYLLNGRQIRNSDNVSSIAKITNLHMRTLYKNDVLLP
jgi:hypothetical protein